MVKDAGGNLLTGAEAPDPEDKKPRSRQELEDELWMSYGWLKPQPVYVDHYTASIMSKDQIFRISFGEWIGEDQPALYRLAVVMPIREARRLHRSLTRLLAKEDERQADSASEEE